MLEISRDIAAYHEAGHAVVAALLGMRVGRITIRFEGETGGCIEIEPVDFEAAPVEHRVMVRFAGSAGTWIGPATTDRSAVWQGMRGDLDAISALLGVTSAEMFADPRFRSASERVTNLIFQERTKRAVHTLAGMLLEREEVNGYTDSGVSRLLISLQP